MSRLPLSFNIVRSMQIFLHNEVIELMYWEVIFLSDWSSHFDNYWYAFLNRNMKTHGYNESVNHELSANLLCEATSTLLSTFQLSNNNKRDMLVENVIGQAKTRNPLQYSVKKNNEWNSWFYWFSHNQTSRSQAMHESDKEIIVPKTPSDTYHNLLN